jgi:hypothetical protein
MRVQRRRRSGAVETLQLTMPLWWEGSNKEVRRSGCDWGVGKIGLAHLAAPHDEATMSRTRSRLAIHRRLRG